MFEETISCTEMIDPSFERKFYGVCYRLYKNIVRGFNRAQCAHKVLKWDFYQDAIYQSLRKSYSRIYYPFFHYCRIFKMIQKFFHKILAKEIFMCTLIYNNPDFISAYEHRTNFIKVSIFSENVIYPLR